MKVIWRLFTLLAVLGVSTTGVTGEYSSEGSALCVTCHDFGPESPVHALNRGSHGIHDDSAEMAGRRGCEDCHGPSADHTKAPTRVPPAVSFGPRWSATGADQDSACLACHEENTAAHWSDAIHMVKGVTCVSCHDIHTDSDRVLFTARQAEVCTMCHKAQKAGMHGLAVEGGPQPHCSNCHNPHDHESAETMLLLTRSEGCRTCHDLVKMAADPDVSAKSKDYHKVMASPERTCVECHGGLAHAATDKVTAFAHQSAPTGTITLFYPGQSDSEWLTQNHPGSQPLRQGANCQLCHRGEESAMGASLASTAIDPSARTMQLAFSRGADDLRLRLRWQGSGDDKSVSLMWGQGRDESFRRGGCFAACHSDMPGMARDRGQQTSKYLWSSREQQQMIGQPALVKNADDLAALVNEGAFAALWQIDLASGDARTARVLERVNWVPGAAFSATAKFADGWWQVDIKRTLNDQTNQLLTLQEGDQYTFGVALHGADNPGAAHWVSLPLTLGRTGNDTDFVLQ